MRLTRTTAAVLLLASVIPAFAATPWAPPPNCGINDQTLEALSLPFELAALAPGFETASLVLEPARTPVELPVTASYAPREMLVEMAMKLRDIRYRRGGRAPSTGFDCSGFVRYVFAHAIGMKLPTSSASQFLAGLKVKRADMKPGDLVFFKTGSKRHISHVGIYISNGRFIHSPASGKTVQVSSLDESYWARHFAGAKRPTAIAAAASNG